MPGIKVAQVISVLFSSNMAIGPYKHNDVNTEG